MAALMWPWLITARALLPFGRGAPIMIARTNRAMLETRPALTDVAERADALCR